MAWGADGFEAIHLFVDPALRDQADELCAAVRGWSGVHQDLDDLSDEILRYAHHEGLTVGIHVHPRDDRSAGAASAGAASAGAVSAGVVSITISVD